MPTLPGVWRRRDGGFYIRGRTRDPRTGRRLAVSRSLPNVTRAKDALRLLESELAKLRDGGADATVAIPLFAAYAVLVFKRKVELGRIRSAAGRAKWAGIIATHLIPALGSLRVELIRPADVKAWQGKLAVRIQRDELSPTTANTALAVLRQILGEAVDDYDMRDPMRGVAPFDTREHDPYSEESPNALAPADVPRFLEAMRELYPQHYAFAFLGLATGLRPSSLRPLRRSGPDADVKWDAGLLLIRRSHTIGTEVMETTKTDRHQRIHMPAPLVDVLRWHVNEQLLRRKMRESELLFPAVTGGLRARSCLDKAFADVTAKIELPYRFTPRGMRRTYQDVARAAGVADVVTRVLTAAGFRRD
ncbi:MAG TPA: hypothetical protein VGD80_18645, partial [Kofleriaceae bacterium]